MWLLGHAHPKHCPGSLCLIFQSFSFRHVTNWPGFLRVGVQVSTEHVHLLSVPSTCSVSTTSCPLPRASPPPRLVSTSLSLSRGVFHVPRPFLSVGLSHSQSSALSPRRALPSRVTLPCSLVCTDPMVRCTLLPPLSNPVPLKLDYSVT